MTHRPAKPSVNHRLTLSQCRMPSIVRHACQPLLLVSRHLLPAIIFLSAITSCHPSLHVTRQSSPLFTCHPRHTSLPSPVTLRPRTVPVTSRHPAVTSSASARVVIRGATRGPGGSCGGRDVRCVRSRVRCRVRSVSAACPPARSAPFPAAMSERRHHREWTSSFVYDAPFSPCPAAGDMLQNQALFGAVHLAATPRRHRAATS